MNNLDDYYWYIVLFVLMFFSILAIKYIKYWNQLKNTYLKLGMSWPIPTPLELNKVLRTDMMRAIFVVNAIPIRAIRLVFFTRNPALQEPIRRIRYCLLAMIIFPLVLMLLLIVFTLTSSI